jgi:DNA invertase Pin-like site-specific DNA recombinase
VFTDVRSGRSMDQPGLAALLDYACPGDTLAVVRLDRLGRSPAELLATVARLKERGVALLSFEERIDTASAAGELVFHMFGAIAHFARRLIAERTKDGIAAARPRQASGPPAARQGQEPTRGLHRSEPPRPCARGRRARSAAIRPAARPCPASPRRHSTNWW